MYNRHMKGQGFFQDFSKHLLNIKQFLERPSFANWKTVPMRSLTIYAQLANSFGFALYKKVFRRYIDDKIKPKNDADKIQTWIIVTSEAAGYNLLPLYDFWAFPISQIASNKLERLPAFLPDDFITKLDPGRVRGVLQKYKGVTRQARKVQDAWAAEVAKFREILPNDVRTL